jgi:hypothetical protein
VNCHRARELASEAVDGALPADLALGFREHLESCPPCRVFVADLKEALALLGELPTVEVSDRFDDVVWAKLSERGVRRGRRTWRDQLLPVDFSWLGRTWRFAPLAAAAALLLVFALTAEPEFSEGGGAARSTLPGVPAGTLARLETGQSGDLVVSPETSADMGEEVLGEMPEAIEAYLRSGAMDLRLESTERLRRANYSYPLRRVGEPGLIRVGTSNGYGAPSVVRPVADAGATVIAF